MAQVIWCWIRDNIGWATCLTSLDRFVEEVLEEGEGVSKISGWKLTILIGWLGVLWKTRNDLSFSNILVKSPKQVVHKIIGIL